MQDKTLLKIAIVTGLIGIVALYFITLSTDLIQIHELPMQDIGKTVKIRGEIVSIRNMNGATLVEIKAVERVPVLIFDDYDANIGSEIVVGGMIEKYKGKYEIIADSIE